jgi:hydrogenase 3 maturation protease
LRRLRPNNLASRRWAVVGIGNELNGDDGAGVAVVRRLREQIDPAENVLLVEAGAAPESFTGVLRRFRPGVVLLVDAAGLDGPPGSIQLIEWQSIDGLSATTHTLPPSVLIEYLIVELGCTIGVIGIQPASLELDAPLSPAVSAAVEEVATALRELLGE